MNLGPILPGRLPSTLQSTRLLDRLNSANRELAILQDQVATGQQFFTPSEDPDSAIRTIYLQSTIERKAQYQQNLQTSRSFLSASEGALGTVNDALNRSQALLLQGIGDTVDDTERDALAEEVAQLIRSVVDAGNTTFRGRYLFGGSQSDTLPFELIGDGVVRHNGDDIALNTFIDHDQLFQHNVTGVDTFNALVEPNHSDVNPALTLNSKLTDLHGGIGVPLGSISISVDDGVNPVQNATVNLASARTIGDVKTLVENAFAAGPATVTVDVDPASNNGIRIQQSGGAGGTVTVTDLAGSQVASQLGILGTGVTINGSDLDPRLTTLTRLADLNGGTGIGTTSGNGITITVGANTRVIDVNAATTIEDFFNLVDAAGLDVRTGINTAGNALVVSSSRSGVTFGIGENNANNAQLLGLRTMTATHQLADLNHGLGIPNQEKDANGVLLPAEFTITRRDGTTDTVDVAGLTTVQQVLDTITAVDANLTATLNAVGNGISITDTSGVGPLIVESTEVSLALGIAGSETGAVNTVPLVGKDVHQRESGGVIDVLLNLEAALRAGDNAELARLDGVLKQAIDDFTASRGEIGTQLKLLDDVEARLLDEDVLLQTSLSEEFDTDLAETITRVANVQSALEATLQIAATTASLSLFEFL